MITFLILIKIICFGFDKQILEISYYNRTQLRQGINIAKSNNSN